MSARLASVAEDELSGTVSVLLPLPLVGPYDYKVPGGAVVVPGAFVEVPLGPRRLIGVVWGAGEGGVDPKKLREMTALLDLPPMPSALRDFIDWVAGYTLAAPGAVLRMAMSVPAALTAPRPRAVVARAGAEPERLTPQRSAVLAALDRFGAVPQAELARAAGVGGSVVRGLIDTGVLQLVAQSAEPEWPVPDPNLPGPTLSDAQSIAATALAADVDARQFAVTLLDGVTGAGKTEVYFEAVAAALAAGRQVVVMLPEIALGAQWLARFKTRFGVAPAEWHSELRQSRRRETWRAVIQGRARVVVGARSALFLPYRDLGLIIVDEEHDASFKQEEGVIYNARDMAVVRGRIAEAPVVLASATPSLETVSNVEAERYRRRAGDPGDRHARHAAGSRLVDSAAAGRRAGTCLCRRRTGHAVSEPAWLRAIDLVPRVRPSAGMSQLFGLAGRASARRRSPLPSLRSPPAGAGHLPELPSRRYPRRLRARH
jgi:primosomal protein N' (replication factor Y)